MKPSKKRTILPLPAVHVDRVIFPVKTQKQIKCHISSVDVDGLPFCVHKDDIAGTDKIRYTQRVHNGSLIVASPMTIRELMLSVPETSVLN